MKVIIAPAKRRFPPPRPLNLFIHLYTDESKPRLMAGLQTILYMDYQFSLPSLVETGTWLEADLSCNLYLTGLMFLLLF